MRDDFRWYMDEIILMLFIYYHYYIEMLFFFIYSNNRNFFKINLNKGINCFKLENKCIDKGYIQYGKNIKFGND